MLGAGGQKLVLSSAGTRVGWEGAWASLGLQGRDQAGKMTADRPADHSVYGSSQMQCKVVSAVF